MTGAAPSAAGPRVKRVLTANGLRQLIAFISRMTTEDRAELEGVSTERAPQIVAGARWRRRVCEHLSLEPVQICPWALREGIILRRLTVKRTGPFRWNTDRGMRNAMTEDGTPGRSRSPSKGYPSTNHRPRRSAWHRRRKRRNAVSVAELTGEIPDRPHRRDPGRRRGASAATRSLPTRWKPEASAARHRRARRRTEG